jgi:hypothetical protein
VPKPSSSSEQPKPRKKKASQPADAIKELGERFAAPEAALKNPVKRAPAKKTVSVKAAEEPLYQKLKDVRDSFGNHNRPAPLAGVKPKLQRAKKKAGALPEEKPASKNAYKKRAEATEDVIKAKPRKAQPSMTLPPERDRLVLMPRDPWWVFAYWDISAQLLSTVLQSVGLQKYHAVIRLYDVTDIQFNGSNAHRCENHKIRLEQEGVYLKVPEPGRHYMAEIGLQLELGSFLPLVRSALCEQPMHQPAVNSAEAWIDLFEQANELWQASWGSEGRFDATGSGHLLGSGSVSGFGQSAIGSGSGSGGFEYLQNQAGSSESSSSFSGGQWGESLSSLHVAGSGFVNASPSSPWGGDQESKGMSDANGGPGLKKGRKFFLWSKTELVLYGGTEPDAKLSVAGLPVRLRADGTFTMRFALPDGDIELEVKAVSADEEEQRSMNHKVTKRTVGP